eukprot:scaffold30_cov416-Prasinococcus_capsulatus_cf.AAC.17
MDERRAAHDALPGWRRTFRRGRARTPWRRRGGRGQSVTTIRGFVVAVATRDRNDGSRQQVGAAVHVPSSTAAGAAALSRQVQVGGVAAGDARALRLPVELHVRGSLAGHHCLQAR